MNKMKINYKVPFRRVYSYSFKQIIKATIWCHFVIKLFPCVHNFESDALLDYYIKKKSNLYEQMESVIKKAKRIQDKKEQKYKYGDKK